MVHIWHLYPEQRKGALRDGRSPSLEVRAPQGKEGSPLSTLHISLFGMKGIDQMAIYHLEMKKISRSKGQNSLAKLAYISGFKVKNQRTNRMYNYSRKERVIGTYLAPPDGLNPAYKNPEAFFNHLEKTESSSTACTAREIVGALPRETTYEENLQIISDFAKPFRDRGYYCFIAIHGGNNLHFHLEVGNRPIDPKTGDFQKVKTKKVFERDSRGNKIPLIDPETGKQKVRVRKGHGEEKLWKRKTVESNWIDTKECLFECRSHWADCCNRYLEPDQQIDHRSNPERGIDRMPTIHEGYAAQQMEKRGEKSLRVRKNKIIRESWAVQDAIRNLEAEELAKQSQPDLYQELASIESLEARGGISFADDAKQHDEPNNPDIEASRHRPHRRRTDR